MQQKPPKPAPVEVRSTIDDVPAHMRRLALDTLEECGFSRREIWRIKGVRGGFEIDVTSQGPED